MTDNELIKTPDAQAQLQELKQTAEHQRLQQIQKIVECANAAIGQRHVLVDTPTNTLQTTILQSPDAGRTVQVEYSPFDGEITEARKKEVLREGKFETKQRYENKLVITILDKDDEDGNFSAVRITTLFGKPQRLTIMASGSYSPPEYDEFFDKLENPFGHISGEEIGFECQASSQDDIDRYNAHTANLASIADRLTGLSVQYQLVDDLFEHLQENYGENDVSIK